MSEWCDVWDGLFWRFIGNHKDFLAKNPRLSMMARTFDKMDPGRKKYLLALAETTSLKRLRDPQRRPYLEKSVASSLKDDFRISS